MSNNVIDGVTYHSSLSNKVDNNDLFLFFRSFVKSHEGAARLFHRVKNTQIRSLQIHNWDNVLKSINFISACDSVSVEDREIATVATMLKDIHHFNLKNDRRLSASIAEEVLFGLRAFNQEPQRVQKVRNLIKYSADDDFVPLNDYEKLFHDAERFFLALTPISFGVHMSNYALENGYASDAASFHLESAKILKDLYFDSDEQLHADDVLPIYFTKELKVYDEAATKNLRRYVNTWLENVELDNIKEI